MGLGFRAEGSKAEVGAVVPFMVQEQLWEKLELISLLQSTGGPVMSPSTLLGRWAVPLSGDSGWPGGRWQHPALCLGKLQQQCSLWSSFWNNPCGWSHGWRPKLCI